MTQRNAAPFSLLATLGFLGAAAASLLPASLVEAQNANRGNPGTTPATAPSLTPAATGPVRSVARLQQLLAQYDAAPANSSQRATLERAVDDEAGQRYATISRLFWYTDIDAAKAAAKASGRPILSLRMLGELTNDLSCANSRFFRTALYADPTVSGYLRNNFVLHWSSERPIPTVTIDIGDGRRLVRTTTGNGAHYILDQDGRPIDALPGLYAPTQFIAGLKAAAAVAQRVRHKPTAQRNSIIAAYHRNAQIAVDKQWSTHPGVATVRVREQLASADDVKRYIDTAQRATMAKAYVEVPDLQTINLGPTPESIRASADEWRVIGQAMFGYGTTQAIARPGDAARIAPGIVVESDAKALAAAGWKSGPTAILSGPARALFLQLRHSLPRGAVRPTPASDARALATFEALIVADTAQNEFKLHQQVHALFISALTQQSAAAGEFAAINAAVYAQVFATPPSDPWMGLVQGDAFTGLPGDGITVALPTEATTSTAHR
ncbi:MAG: hypothetical protein KBG15_15035 [Kofleriaceae bacterium]|nr:hypothetical protein [Kofleriaceae bacterium]